MIRDILKTIKMIYDDAHMFDDYVDFDTTIYDIKPHSDCKSRYNDNPGYLETFDDEKALAWKIYQETPKKVWTIIDAEDGHTMVISAGWHYCNRCAFYVSDVEWADENEEYIWAQFERERFWWWERFCEAMCWEWPFKMAEYWHLARL